MPKPELGFEPPVAQFWADLLNFVKIPSELLVQDPAPTKDQFLFALNSSFVRSLQTPEGKAFEQEIAAELARIGSTLTPFQIAGHTRRRRS